MSDERELIAALQQLANRWTLKARDHARESKQRQASSDVTAASYFRGMAESYHKAALELADLLNQRTPASAPVTATTVTNAVTPAPAPSAPSSPMPPPARYAPVSINEVMTMLDFAGVTPRDLRVHKDNVVTAVFSRWQPVSDHERIEKIKSADFRIVILNSGKLRDTSDPYVEFAFKE